MNFLVTLTVLREHKTPTIGKRLLYPTKHYGRKAFCLISSFRILGGRAVSLEVCIFQASNAVLGIHFVIMKGYTHMVEGTSILQMNEALDVSVQRYGSGLF